MKPAFEVEKQSRGSILTINQRFYHLAVLIATDDAQQYAQSYSILTKGKRSVFGIKAGLRIFELIKKDEKLKPRWIYPELYGSKKGVKLCLVCGKPTKYGRAYCSPECGEIDWPKNLQADNAGKRIIKNYVPKPCERCGKKFEPKSNIQRFCPECRVIVQKEYKAKVYQNLKAQKALIEKKATCVQCGKEFTPRRANAKYCSAECAHKVDMIRKRRARELLLNK